MNTQKEKWLVRNKKADFKEIGRRFGVDQVLARILVNRGLTEDKEIQKYLGGTLGELHSPHLMKDMDLIIDILQEKIHSGKLIHVIGDYDIDGIMSAYVLLTGISRVGGMASAAIPDRMKDGYGINENLIDRAREKGADTILTCDNGIAALEAVAYAKSLGMTVLVTDHHDIPYVDENGERRYLRSQADAIVNPKQQECRYPFSGICGAVVAWKVIQALYEAEGLPFDACLEFLEHAAFATVGDVMDLADENRIIVKYGIEKMRHTKHPGLSALMGQKNIVPERLGAYHLGFVLGPCINASGRLHTAVRSLKLMLARSREEAVPLAIELDGLNEERKAMTLEGVEHAREEILKQGWDRDKVMVVYLKDLHESLAGIVAGRIREIYHRPVFVVTDSEEGVKGSGRSIEAYSMYEELCKCRKYFIKFGGHPMAAGFSMEREDVESFRKDINICCSLSEEDFIPVIHIDVPMPLSYVTKELVDEMELLEPFGKGNPKPVFADKNIKVRERRVVGKNKNVMKLTLGDTYGYTYDAVYFGDVEEFEMFLQEKNEISIIYYPEINSYMGREEIQIVISNYC
ncbi:MAG: single-stranded-DNA-specific exonuclease RecJ [Lachnospiraceae bacterium]|nr:single-stranded-DNA-specific exonuclease RecJ [Lachnospiraceae bacterium]MDE6982278.1 single-stranded-DNA-specific exonuclease RecJ [Lachnospiraceae bacterium]